VAGIMPVNMVIGIMGEKMRGEELSCALARKNWLTGIVNVLILVVPGGH
jgi:hypothetical protein